MQFGEIKFYTTGDVLIPIQSCAAVKGRAFTTYSHSTLDYEQP